MVSVWLIAREDPVGLRDFTTEQLEAELARRCAWIVWDTTVPPVMQRGLIGTEEEVRDEVRKREAFRKTQPSCRHEAKVRYEARRLKVDSR